MRSGTKAQVLLGDDQPIARDGLKLHVNSQPDMQVVGEASTGLEAIRFIRANPPDLLISDLAMRDEGGLQLIGKLTEVRPDIKILVVCAFDEAVYAARVLQVGAMGYVSKHASPDEIIRAAQLILQGGRYLSPAMTSRMLGLTVGKAKRNGQISPLEQLSNRELEVFRMVGEGRTTRQIAETIGLSVHTIESYREKIKSKLDLENSARLGQHAAHWVLEACRGGAAPRIPFDQ